MNADMQPGCGAALVDAEGVPFVKLPGGGVTVAAVLIGAALLGVVGALIAIPVAAALQLLVSELLFPRSTKHDRRRGAARRP